MIQRLSLCSLFLLLWLPTASAQQANPDVPEEAAEPAPAPAAQPVAQPATSPPTQKTPAPDADAEQAPPGPPPAPFVEPAGEFEPPPPALKAAPPPAPVAQVAPAPSRRERTPTQPAVRSIYEVDPGTNLLTRWHRLIARRTFGRSGTATTKAKTFGVEGEKTHMDGISMPGNTGWHFEWQFVSRYFLIGTFLSLTDAAFEEKASPHTVMDLGLSMRIRIPLATAFYRDFVELAVGGTGGLSLGMPDELAGIGKDLKTGPGWVVSPVVTVQMNLLRWLAVFVEGGKEYRMNSYWFETDAIPRTDIESRFDQTVLTAGAMLWF